MSRRELTRTIDNESQIESVISWLREYARQGLKAGAVMVVLTRPRRNLDQSAKFHAICGDVANQLQYCGRWLSKDQWKVLFVSGHAIAEGGSADIVPGLEGEFANLRESTTRMSKERMGGLIEYAQAYGTSQGVAWSEQSQREINP